MGWPCRHTKKKMKNWHYLFGGLLTLLFAQGYYFASMLVGDWDAMLGLPELPYNPYALWPYIMSAATELALVSLVAHSAVTGAFSPFVKSLWVFIGLSAWNQFIDTIFGDIHTFTIQEGIFLCVAISISLLVWLKRK